jgi:hypothetical protein
MSSTMRCTWLAAALLASVVGCSAPEGSNPGRGNALPNGAPCTAATDCASQLCLNGACQSPGGGVGRTNGSPCAGGAECASGNCGANNICQSVAGGNGLANGARCSGPVECASGVCNNGACQGTGRGNGAPNGSTCSGASDCASGACNAGTCGPATGGGTRPNGDGCNANADCRSNVCGNNVCQPRPGTDGRPNGGPCTGNTDCASESCVSGTCRAPTTGGPRPNGDPCAANADCASNVCTSATCQPRPGTTGRPNGVPCAGNSECASENCVASICTAPGGGNPDGGRPDMDGSVPSDVPTGVTDLGIEDSSGPSEDSTVPGEICRNGFDDNMNGMVDEGCECFIGQRQYCYPGPAEQAGVAGCNWGTQRCVGDGGLQGRGSWGPCMDFGRPGAETCNDGIDNNCNREVDENCACTTGQTRSCYAGPMGTAGRGVCAAGMQRCTNGRWTECADQILPLIERCDGRDNDCDGMTDEGCNCTINNMRPCYTGPAGTQGRGICRGGTESCASNPDGTSDWGACAGQVTPQTETCNGADDDCDGMTDEGCSCTPGQTRPCFDGLASLSGVGACRAGRITCLSNGNWTTCENQVTPRPETCDGADNDCNGRADEWCLCPAGQTVTYERRDLSRMANRSKIIPGDGMAIMPQTCGPRRCNDDQVAVEVTDGNYRCVPPPPPCPPMRTPYYTLAGTWRCERGCEVIVQYGHLYDFAIVCAPRPNVNCPPGQTPHYVYESEVWECRATCDNGQYDIYNLGSGRVCIPC